MEEIKENYVDSSQFKKSMTEFMNKLSLARKLNDDRKIKEAKQEIDGKGFGIWISLFVIFALVISYIIICIVKQDQVILKSNEAIASYLKDKLSYSEAKSSMSYAVNEYFKTWEPVWVWGLFVGTIFLIPLFILAIHRFILIINQPLHQSNRRKDYVQLFYLKQELLSRAEEMEGAFGNTQDLKSLNIKKNLLDDVIEIQSFIIPEDIISYLNDFEKNVWGE